MVPRWVSRIFLVPALGAWLLLVSSPGPVPAQAAPPRLTVIAVGDILLGRQLGARMAAANDFLLAFRALLPVLSAADITFGNLEGPFCAQPPYPDSGMVFRVRPRAVEGLAGAGFDVVSVANNHSSDCGEPGIRFSLEHLRRAGIAPVGAGLSFEEAHQGAVIERQGVRFAFLAYSYVSRDDTPEAAGPVIAGRDLAQVARDVAAASARADVVLVSLHDGAEYTSRVAPETREFARAAVEAGATAVLGHHPHVPQAVEAHGGGWIFYSLGNFVFAQNRPGTRTGLLARLTFSGPALEQVEAIPVVIDAYSQPRLATPEEAAAVLEPLGLASPVVWSAAGLLRPSGSGGQGPCPP